MAADAGEVEEEITSDVPEAAFKFTSGMTSSFTEGEANLILSIASSKSRAGESTPMASDAGRASLAFVRGTSSGPEPGGGFVASPGVGRGGSMGPDPTVDGATSPGVFPGNSPVAEPGGAASEELATEAGISIETDPGVEGGGSMEIALVPGSGVGGISPVVEPGLESEAEATGFFSISGNSEEATGTAIVMEPVT